MTETKFNHCSIIDNDCATGKTYHVLSLCALWLQKKSYKGIVYACRTIELINEIYQRAIANHHISKEDIIVTCGSGSTGVLQKEMKRCQNKLIITTHDAIIHLSHTSKKGFILIHDEKPSDNNIISVMNNITELFDKLPDLKDHIRFIKPNTEYRNKKYFSNVGEKYYQIVLKSRYKTLKLLSKLLKIDENEQFFDVIFFIKDLLMSNVEYYIKKTNYLHLFSQPDECSIQAIKLMTYNPYNKWDHVFFIFSHSSLNDQYELGFVRKLKLFDVDYNFYDRWAGKEKKFSYHFDNVSLHTSNTTKNWSKTYYSKDNRFSKALDSISQKISEQDKILVLCNKGYEDKILAQFKNAIILDHAPYGKEKEDYLKCNVIIDISAKYHSLQDQRMLKDFGFDENVALWNKTDDIIQYLMRSKARFNQHENIKLFVLNSKTAKLLSSVLGLKLNYDVLVDDDCRITDIEKDAHQSSITANKKYYITVYQNTRQTEGNLYCSDNFDEIISKIPMDHHKNSGCYFLGKSVEGGRKKVDIECLSFLTFDFDNQTKRIQTETSVVKQIKNVFPDDIVFFVQRTFTNGNYRVIIPLSECVSVDFYERAMKFFVSKMKNIDVSCSRATQVYFSPKHDFKKYGSRIFDIKEVNIPEIKKIDDIKTKKLPTKNIEMAMLMINAVPKKVRKSNDYCVKLVSGMKKLIGANSIENADIWGLLFDKMRVLLQHEGATRINDFVKMSYR